MKNSNMPSGTQRANDLNKKKFDLDGVVIVIGTCLGFIIGGFLLIDSIVKVSTLLYTP